MNWLPPGTIATFGSFRAMKCTEQHSTKVQDRDGNEQCIWSLCFSPEGTVLVAGAGNRVLVYNTEEWALLKALKGHKDTVFCVAYSRDGRRFASGGADKNVIIWTNQLEGILKYAHNDSIQCLSFNPVSHSLASCAVTDFGLWSQEQKSVTKHKVPSRITSCSWTNDGQYLAIGMFNGVISIRNKQGEEKVRIERGGNFPIWSIEWNPSREEQNDVLAVLDWGGRLGFHQLNGKQINKDRPITGDPSGLCWFKNGQYLAVCGGSEHAASLYTKDGVRLGQICQMQSWIWTCHVRSDTNVVAVGCQDGTISCYQITFGTVHSLYKDRYAYREHMTDVIVQHLITEQRVRIKCKDLVKKVAIYRQRLAVQLQERMIIYELQSGADDTDMRYKVRERLQRKLECNLLVITANHLILCLEQKLQCLNFQGVKEREWTTDSLIRYIRVLGGPAGKEAVLVGLKSGQILKIFVDNPFPVELVRLSSAVRCLDCSASRRRLAVVDDHNTCSVYDLQTKELLFQEPNATSAVWNTHFEDMFCYSGNGSLSIKAANFPAHQQKLQGFVVGFSGSKIFCLHQFTIQSIEVPQSASMYQYLEKKQFNEAFQIACLGVTDQDWETLALEALEGLDYEIAKKAFIRVQNSRYLDLIQSITDRRRRGEGDSNVFLGDINSYQGRFQEAAKLYRRAGNDKRAADMFADLRMFDFARDYLGAEDQKELMARKADHAKTSDPRAAAEIYISTGEWAKAIEIAGENGFSEVLIDIARKVDKADRPNLQSCAVYLKRLEQFPFAAECYRKMGDLNSLLMLYVDAKMWDEAFQLVKSVPNMKRQVYLPYAQWLAENDKFEEAQKAFHSAGMQQEAVRVLEQLTFNAVTENRFVDAGYYYFSLSLQCLDIAQQTGDRDMLDKFDQYQRRAEIYYVYHKIYKLSEEPFRFDLPGTVFNMCRFLVHAIGDDEAPAGVSKTIVLYTWAQTSRTDDLGAYKQARFAYKRLQSLHIPHRLQDQVSLGSLTIRAKPYSDDEKLLPMCSRCACSNPLLNPLGNQCCQCKQPFVNCFISFDTLPLVEFVLEDGISDEEALSLIEAPSIPAGGCNDSDEWRESRGPGGQESLRLDESVKQMVNERNALDEAFSEKTLSLENGVDVDASADLTGDFSPVRLGREYLRMLNPTEVIVQKWPPPLRYRFYRNMMPDDVQVTLCRSCNKLFNMEDFELEYLQRGHCPYCRVACREDVSAAGQYVDEQD